jgi:hypothetical protein
MAEGSKKNHGTEFKAKAAFEAIVLLLKNPAATAPEFHYNHNRNDQSLALKLL